MAVSKKYKKGRPYGSQKSGPLPELIHKETEEFYLLLQNAKNKTNSFEAEGGDRNCLWALAETFLEEREKVFYIVV